MTDWSVVFLGAMAVSLVVMAAIQIGLIVVALKVGRQVTGAAEELRQELRPLMAKVNRIADDASRMSATVAAQADRIDTLVASVCDRVDETVGILQGAVIEPVRQGAAVIAALRAAISGFRSWREQREPRADRHADDEAMFVG